MMTSPQLLEKGVLHDLHSPSCDALPGVGGLASARTGHKGAQGLLDEEETTDDDDPDD